MGALNARCILKLFGAAVGVVCASVVAAGELTVPNQFSNGQATSASEMNANFSAVESAVNDNDQRISQLEGNGPVVFQGFSDGTMNGGQGLLTMTQACDTTFQGSRMCTTTEFRDSPFNSNAGNLDTNAWINPVVIGVGTGTGSGSPAYGAVEVVSGTILENPRDNATCSGWNTNAASPKGTVVSPMGQIIVNAVLTSCANEYRIACCK